MSSKWLAKNRKKVFHATIFGIVPFTVGIMTYSTFQLLNALLWDVSDYLNAPISVLYMVIVGIGAVVLFTWYRFAYRMFKRMR